ncbi:MAG: DNA mismatch repair endonuclease MutL [Cyclobacteriaceae bacterium]
MSDIIKLLPDAIANQIAAGEVVQRPASVVKELLENSVDAGSKQVTLIVKDSGKALVQVSDDGMGMSETDARMSFERHATSKIRSAEDLFSIRTKGFRGEALASIGAVAQVEMKTRTQERELGTLICVEGTQVKKQEHVAAPTGTSISVKNLFFNVPARRNFLKSNPVEMRHILDEFFRISLAHPEVGFSLYQNDLETFQLEGSKLSQRIVGLFGKNYREQLVPCSEETPHLNIQGYIGKPEFAKKTRGEQFFFINNRFIKNNYLNHAVSTAFDGLIADDQYPFYVLFITIDPKHVDVNVHPTKTEVKFDDERTIYGIVKSAVKQALGAHSVMPSLDFNTDVNFEAIARSGLNFDRQVLSSKAELDYSKFKTASPREEGNLKNWETLFSKAKSESDYQEEVLDKENALSQDAVVIASNANNIESPGEEDMKSPPWQLHKRHVLKQVKSGLMIMDQQFAHERILFERFNAQIQSKEGLSQQSLFPAHVELNPADFSLVMELQDEIKSLGFVFDVFGKNAIAIQGIPADVRETNEKVLFEGLIEQFKWNRETLSIDKQENISRALAKRSSIKPGHQLDQQEMNAMIDQLFACQQPNYTPDGKPTFVLLGLDKIANFFNR